MGSKADFFQGETEDLVTIVQDVDVAFFCNAIHLIVDKLCAIQQIAAILAPGGILACNSAFYDGTNLDDTFRFSRLWIRRAVGWLRKNHPEVRLSREAKATARQWLSPQPKYLLPASLTKICLRYYRERSFLIGRVIFPLRCLTEHTNSSMKKSGNPLPIVHSGGIEIFLHARHMSCLLTQIAEG